MNREIIALESLLKDYLYGKIDITHKIEKEVIQKEPYEFIKSKEKRDAVKRGITLEEAIRFYLDEAVKSGNKESTVRTKRKKLNPFKKFLQNHLEVNSVDYISDFAGIDESLIKMYISSKRSESESNYTKSSIQVLRGFYNYLEKEKMIEVNPMNEVMIYKRKFEFNKTKIKFLTHSQITGLVECFDNTQRSGLRNLLVTALILESGMLPSEIVSIKYENIVFERNEIYIGTKENLKILQFSDQTILLLQKYLQTFGLTEGYLFRHKRRKDEKTDSRTISRMFDAYEKRFDFEVNPTILRNTFAKDFLKIGNGILELSNVLGIRLDSCKSHYSEFLVRRESIVGGLIWNEN